ncbi:MAG: ABC transporter permease subunit [Dongiaceae bacterium]
MSRPRPGGGFLLRHGRLLLIGGLLAWYALFFLVPFLFVVKISVAGVADGIPPYTPLLSTEGSRLSLDVTFDNFARLVTDPVILKSYMGSLRTAALTTLLCILIGYPIAYAVSAERPSLRPALLMLITIPFWTSFLIRIYAWIGLLKDNGVINNLLLWTGLIDQPLTILNTSVSIYVGMVYCYLPFFILPLYAVLEKRDLALEEAASDLGSRPFYTFLSVTLPLSLPGVFAGALLVFVPATGEYLIPRLLGGAVNLMIAPVLWDSFFVARDWPIAAAATVALVLILLLPLALVDRVRRRAAEAAA